MKRFILFAIILMLCTGCGTFNPSVYDQAFNQLNGQAQKHMDKEEYSEALLLYRTLSDAEPENEEVKQNMDLVLKNDPDLSFLLTKKKLGSNLTDRIPLKDVGLGKKIICYLPNRILDFLDIITLEIGMCLGAGLDLKITEYVTIGAQVSAGETMIGLNRRHLSARATIEEYFEILAVEAHALLENRAYTGGLYSLSYANADIKAPEDKIFQRARDFWTLSTSIELIVLSEKHEIHPVELWDFLAGWVLVDPLNDDLGSSKAIKLTPLEKDTMRRLTKQVKARGEISHTATKLSEEKP